MAVNDGRLLPILNHLCTTAGLSLVNPSPQEPSAEEASNTNEEIRLGFNLGESQMPLEQPRKEWMHLPEKNLKILLDSKALHTSSEATRTH